MKRFVFVMMAFFVFSMTGQPVFAENNLIQAASTIERGILNSLSGIGDSIALAAKEAGKRGIDKETEIRELLQKNYSAGKPYGINSTFINSKGVMTFIEPGEYKKFEGSDISNQEAVMKMMKGKKPRMGNLFLSVEGIQSVDIEYPVFSKGKQFLGSISMIVKPDEMIRAVAAVIEKDRSVKCWVMQKDGLILYETDPTQIGLSLFTDPLYRDYTELIALGKTMIRKKSGKGVYAFQIHGTDKVVKKRAVWKTVHFLSNDWIIVAYKEIQ